MTVADAGYAGGRTMAGAEREPIKGVWGRTLRPQRGHDRSQGRTP